MRTLFFLLLIFVSTTTGIKAQQIEKKLPSYAISKTQALIKVDGVLDEAIWQSTPSTGSFYQNFPSDTSMAQSQTSVQLTFNEQYLYIAAICYERVHDVYVIPTLKRDFNYQRSDAFAVYLDPANDKTSGFNFTVNPYGVQREGLITNGGIQGVTTNWDNKWISAVKTYEDKWIVEIAIPFKTLRYNPEVREWGLNFSRLDLKMNESSTWAHVGRNFNVSALGFAGKLAWQQLPPPAGKNFSIIPYIRANYADQNKPYYDQSKKVAAGGDIKVGVTSSLNLDITINPDFSEAEVDQQVIVLDRFSIFFPERRNFFIENSDLFASFGFSQIRPFNSRNIGLYKGKVVPILAGARLSGKLDKNWRIGAMSVQTSAISEESVLSQNYSVGAIQRQVGKASNLGAIFVNRQAWNNNGLSPNNYNRLAGIDYNFANPKNTWRGRVFYHHSFDPVKKINPFAHASWLMHLKRKYEFHWNHEYVGKGYNAEVGYVPRQAYWRLEPSANYYMYPKNSIINRMGPQVYLSLYTKADDIKTVTDNYWRAGYKFEFQNTATLSFNYDNYFIKLMYPFDISGIGQLKHPMGNYTFGQTKAHFTSNYRKLFYYEANLQYGGYFSGRSLVYSGSLSYRWQPYVNFGLSAYRNEIYLSGPYKNAFHTLIGPRIDVSFSKSLFFNTWVQYNAQYKYVNMNSRLQWRFKPMSDLYIVYNRNWESVGMEGLNQALIVKLNWWLNL